MANAVLIRTPAEIAALRTTLRATAALARKTLRSLIDQPDLLDRLKFERLGCDPLDPADAQNLAEQIDQQATYDAAVDALEALFARFPGREWTFAPGAHGSGHDIASTDGMVAAEVFAAVKPSNNRKLSLDIAKVRAFEGVHKFDYYRSPGSSRSTSIKDGVEVVSLGKRAGATDHR